MKTVTLKKIQQEIMPLVERYDLKKVGVFGSYAKGNASVGSDIDLLIDVPRKVSLIEILQLESELSETLGKKVDLVEYNSLKSVVRDEILKSQKVIYEAA